MAKRIKLPAVGCLCLVAMAFVPQSSAQDPVDPGRQSAFASGDLTGLQHMNQLRTPQADLLTAIVGGRLIDGQGGPPQLDATVIVRGNRIVAVGASNEVDIPSDAVVCDAQGLTVLPGLLDAHFHSRDTVEQPVEFLLWNGVTSFRDPGHPFKYYDVLLNTDEMIPRVFLCGGHLDRPPVVWPDQAERITTPQQAADAVNQHADRGASAIKVYFRLPLPDIRAACLAAKARGIPVTAHLELVDADDAIDAGIAGVEHITSFGTVLAEETAAEQFRSVVDGDSAARREWRYRLWDRIEIDGNSRVTQITNKLAREGVFVCPTLAVFERRAGKKAATAVEAHAFDNMLQFTAACHKAGVALVVGSHTSGPLARRGKAYLREMELLVEAGMEPLEVITAATETNARFFGVAERLGTIEPGKLADLVIVRGDPSRRIQDIDQVERVMLNGIWVDRPSDR